MKAKKNNNEELITSRNDPKIREINVLENYEQHQKIQELYMKQYERRSIIARYHEICFILGLLMPMTHKSLSSASVTCTQQSFIVFTTSRTRTTCGKTAFCVWYFFP